MNAAGVHPPAKRCREKSPPQKILLLVVAGHVRRAHRSYLTTVAWAWTEPKARFVPLGLSQQPGPREMSVAGGVYNLCLVTESLDAHSASLHTMGSNGSGMFPRSLRMKSLHLPLRCTPCSWLALLGAGAVVPHPRAPPISTSFPSFPAPSARPLLQHSFQGLQRISCRCSHCPEMRDFLISHPPTPLFFGTCW